MNQRVKIKTKDQKNLIHTQFMQQRNLSLATPQPIGTQGSAGSKILNELEELAEGSEYYSIGNSAISSTQFAAMEQAQQNFISMDIRKLIWHVSYIDILAFLFNGIINICSYNLVYQFGGLKAIATEASVLPLIILLCRNPSQAIFSSISGPVFKALAIGNINVANIYVSHAVLISIIWDVIILIVFVAWNKQLLFLIVSGPYHVDVDFTFGRKYLIASFVIFPIAYTFSTSLNILLKLENRSFLYLLKIIYLGILSLLLLYTSYFISAATIPGFGLEGSGLSTGLELELVAYSIGAANLIVGLWMIVVFVKKTILDIPLHGGLGFSFRRLFPLNGRVILRIFVQGLASWSGMSVLNILIFSLNIVYAQCYTDTVAMMHNKTAYLNYMLMYNVASVFLDGMRPGISTIASYNYGLRNYKRLYSLIKYGWLYCTIATTVICLVLGCLSDYIISSYQPSLNPANRETSIFFYVIGNPIYKRIGKSAFYTPPLIVAHNIAQVMASVDNNRPLFYLFMFVRPVCIFVLLLVLALTNGNGADFSVCFPIGDGIASVVGLLAFAMYLIKYRGLAVKVGDAETCLSIEPTAVKCASYSSERSFNSEALSDYSTEDITVSCSNTVTEESSFTGSSRRW